MTKEDAETLLKSNFKKPDGVIDYEGKLQPYSTYIKSQNDDFTPYIKIGEKEFTLQEYIKLVYNAQ